MAAWRAGLVALFAGCALLRLAIPAAGAPANDARNPAAATGVRPWGILTLIGGNLLAPSNAALDGAMRKALTAPGQHPVDFFSEALDAQRFPQAHMENELVALLAKKYAQTQIDAVVAVGTASLNFAEKHRNELWPEARILFQVVPVESLHARPLSPTTTGIPIQWDLGGTVDLALALRPATRRVVVIHGSGEYDRSLAGIARKQLERFTPRLAVEYWPETSIDRFLQQAAELRSDDAVLYLSIARDTDGRTFIPRDLAARLSAVSPAPVYGPFETYLDEGIVAGMIYSYEALGTRMAKLVQDALAAPATPLPWVTMKSNCMADARLLQRFGMDEGRLPADCDIRFASPSLWREYRWLIVGAGLAFVAQTALILGLLLQRRARRSAEAEARRRRAELTQASRLALAGELTASIAHEINQPLGAILANAGAAEALLRRGSVNVDEMAAIVADIKKADLRASEVIRRVRALVTSRQSEREPEDPNAIVGDVLAFLQREAGRRGVVVDTSFDPGVPKLEMDRVQLQQAIANLCVNAMDAMADTPPGRRRLGVRTAAGGDGSVEITVTDTGSGIPAEQLPRLFESFFTTKAEGMGLGLSIARSIVEAHDGTLTVANRAEGGAAFRIVLPATRGAHASRRVVPGDAVPVPPRRATSS